MTTQVTIPITLNLTYNQIKALNTLGFTDANVQLKEFSSKIYEIRRAIDHISNFIRYISNNPDNNNLSKFKIIHEQFKRLVDKPYSIIQTDNDLRNAVITGLHCAESLAEQKQPLDLEQVYIKRMKIAQQLLWKYVKHYSEF